MKKCSANQEKLLEYIKECYLSRGYAPNIREMCSHLGVNSTCTVVYYLKKLEEKGLIKRENNKNRAITYLGEGRQEIENSYKMVKLPYLGNVAGGIPLLAEENLIDTFSISQNFFGTNQEIFMLKVVGESMIDIGINDGDFVVAKVQNTAENGEIVVARTENGTTVKKYYKESEIIRLQPANPSFLPILVRNVEILGKVIACIKLFERKKHY